LYANGNINDCKNVPSALNVDVGKRQDTDKKKHPQPHPPTKPPPHKKERQTPHHPSETPPPTHTRKRQDINILGSKEHIYSTHNPPFSATNTKKQAL
jgi:hypothetical protein